MKRTDRPDASAPGNDIGNEAPDVLPSAVAAGGGLRRALLLLAAGAAIAVGVLVVLAYQRPELLLDAVNVRYCG